tara:strand:- start:3803 stop:4927 length:1125 start_codon:yes stop_codon:yes gene_type:complete
MSIVAMKRKMEAKKNQSRGGAFSLNGKRCNSDVVIPSVKNARYARSNHFKTKACFNGEGGVQCERVWDGKRMPGIWEDYGGGTPGGESLTQEEFIEQKRLKSTECINLLFTLNNFEAGVTTIDIFKDVDTFSFNYGGKKYTPVWNHSYTYIASVIRTAVRDKTALDLLIASKKKEGAEAAMAKANLVGDTDTAENVRLSVDGTTNALATPEYDYYQLGIDAIKDAISEIIGTGKDAKDEAAAALAVIVNEHTVADNANTNANTDGHPILDSFSGTIKSVGVKGLRKTVTTVGTADLSFKNPEITIFEPVGCLEGLTQSGDGGTTINDVGYYGRGTCKVHYVRKDRSLEIKSYDGLGGHLSRLKQPHLDPSFCGV